MKDVQDGSNSRERRHCFKSATLCRLVRHGRRSDARRRNRLVQLSASPSATSSSSLFSSASKSARANHLRPKSRPRRMKPSPVGSAPIKPIWPALRTS